jgi:hypothetical protein
MVDRRSDPFWFDDVTVLYDVQRLTEFFPASYQTPAEKFNAITRMGVYATAILTLMKRTMRFVYMLLIIMFVLFLGAKNMDVKGMFFRRPDHKLTVSEGMTRRQCQAPTSDNPYGNVLLTDIQDNPDRLPACQHDSPEGMQADVKYYERLWMNVEDVYNRQANSRQFYSLPNTEVVNDQTGFARWLYGSDEPTCKEKGIFCTGYD